ncbi:phage tail tape measure protein [Rudanella lutea]|uniref:phage tail tape measure protein n=1 Tax=Rudanella lutea TaxID=451374 RepID=UPI0003774DBD|nr:phage tail tape measure protein [Rudanella lutea]
MQLKEEAVFTLKYDGKPVINQLGELEQRLKDAKVAQSELTRGTKEWAENKALVKQLEADIKQVREEMGASGMTVQQLKGYYDQLNREIQKLTPGTEAYQKKAAEMVEVNTLLTNHRETIKGVNQEVEKQPSLWERAKATATGFLAGFGATELLERAFSFVQDGIKKALELTDQMSGVAKATNLSTEAVAELSGELDKIDTRSTKESLMDIAQIGGQLGVANEELLGFVKSVDMANVALGDEFSGGAEEVSAKLGGLQKLFKETKDLQAGEAIEKIGSAINELGAAGSATGPVVADFTARMGQLGDLSPQIAETMGLGAAFQELGLSAEIASGGLTNILLTAAKDTATFAQQLGITRDEMKQLINTNPNEFLLRLAESLKNVPADQLATRLDDLGIKSQEATKVMSLLKDQTQMVREKQDLANKAMAEGTSLQKEFNTVNNNAAAEYDKSQKALALLATNIGQALLPAITTGTRGLVAFVNIIRAVPEFVSENRTSFAALGLAVLAFNGHLIAATATSIGHAAAEKARLIWTQSATVAQTALNVAMTSNPIGVVVAAVALLVAGFTALYNNSSTVRGIISGTWEAMKTGVSLVADLTNRFADWIKQGLEPLQPALTTVGGWLSNIWDLVKAGAGFVYDLHMAFVDMVGNGLGRISAGLAPVRTALANFWGLIDTGITKIKQIGGAIASFLHVDDVVNTVKSAAGKIGDAFNKGYGDKLNEDRPKQLAAHQKHLDDKKGAEQKTAGQLVDIVTTSEQKAIDRKAAQNDKHRESELKKAADKAQKEKEDQIRANDEANKAIETARINAITNDLEREKAKLEFKYQQELAAIEKSKASQSIKAVWEKALHDQLQRDKDKAETDYRAKQEKEEAETAKRILDLKVRLSGDEKADKLQKLEDVAAAQRAQVEKDVADETQKAQLLKQINENLIRDKEAVEADYRAKKAAQEQALQDNLYQATVADANARLVLAGNNAQAIYDAKKMRLDAEYEHNRQKLEREAAEEKAKNQALITDHDTRAQADKAIDDRLKSQLKANDVQYENDKTQLTRDKTEARRQNQQEFFDAVKKMMEGDFTTFSNLLMKKMAGEKKQLTESQQANVDKIDQVGSYFLLATQAMSKIAQIASEREIAKIKKEKDTQLAAWKEQYDKGLISKEEYEAGTDKINKEADAKIKEQQLKAWKRQQALDITQAVIHGAMAALKSLATMGFPLGLIGVAGAAAATAIQIALIKRQQPPQMARGGMIRNAGVPDGPRHGAGYGTSGLSVTRRDNGEEVAEMEGGEPIMVLSQRTYANNRRVVDALMHSSLHRNGAPIFRNGGIMGTDGGSYSDYVGRGRRFDNGGWMSDYVDTSGGSSDGGSYGGESASPENDAAMNEAQQVASVTNEQIEKSQSQMDAIMKNTAETVLAVDKMGAYLANEFTTMVRDTAGQQMNAQDIAFTALINQARQQGDELRTSLDTNMKNLTDTMRQQGEQLILALETNMKNLGDTVRQQGTEQLTAIQNQTSTLKGSMDGQTGSLLGELRNQSGALGVIASKDLSVQTYVNVVNQIDVVANKSDFQ